MWAREGTAPRSGAGAVWFYAQAFRGSQREKELTYGRSQLRAWAALAWRQ